MLRYHFSFSFTSAWQPPNDCLHVFPLWLPEDCQLRLRLRLSPKIVPEILSKIVSKLCTKSSTKIVHKIVLKIGPQNCPKKLSCIISIVYVNLNERQLTTTRQCNKMMGLWGCTAGTQPKNTHNNNAKSFFFVQGNFYQIIKILTLYYFQIGRRLVSTFE